MKGIEPPSPIMAAARPKATCEALSTDARNQSANGGASQPEPDAIPDGDGPSRLTLARFPLIAPSGPRVDARIAKSDRWTDNDEVQFRWSQWGICREVAKVSVRDEQYQVERRVRVVLAVHLSGDKLLGYENSLAVNGRLIRTDEPCTYIVEVFRQDRLQSLAHSLPYWQRSGACVAWELLQ
jgi:hypothetical protein